MRKPRCAVVPSVEMIPGSPVLPVSGGPSTPSRALGALDLRCSYCGALPGQPCRERDTGTERPGGPHRSRAESPVILKWRAWHGDRNASRLAPPL